FCRRPDRLKSVKNIPALKLRAFVPGFSRISPGNMVKGVAAARDPSRKIRKILQGTVCQMDFITERKPPRLSGRRADYRIYFYIMSETFFDQSHTDHTRGSGNYNTFHFSFPHTSGIRFFCSTQIYSLEILMFSSISSAGRKGYISSSGADTILPSGSFLDEVLGSVFWYLVTN